MYDGTWTNVPLRLTWQATPRNKFNIFWDEQKMCLECEAGVVRRPSHQRPPAAPGIPTFSGSTR